MLLSVVELIELCGSFRAHTHNVRDFIAIVNNYFLGSFPNTLWAMWLLCGSSCTGLNDPQKTPVKPSFFQIVDNVPMILEDVCC